MSLERHAAHQTNALDLGYYSNTLWNTIHGAPFRFTTYHDARFAFPEFDPRAIKRQDNLLAFHVEPILLPLSLIYAIFPDPRALLIIQSLALTSGALPALRIARRRLDGYAALVFPVVYLLSPSLIGANLSDFHPVSFSAALFPWAFDALERRALKLYFAFILLILSLKEEMALIVAMMGLYAMFGRGKRASGISVRVGFLTLALAILWVFAALLIQRDAAGLPVSPFLSRYTWLGGTAWEMIVNALTTTALLDWLKQPEAYGYLGFLLAQTGFCALFAPEILLIALPEIAINTFSSFEWMRSGVAHYSAPIVPWLVIASIVGARRVADWGAKVVSRLSSRFGRLAHAYAQPLISLLILVFALYQCYHAGQLPLTAGFMPFAVTDHHRLLPSITAKIPPGANVSAQSDLYPHVPERANLYLFPTISDAEYILLDVTGQTYPIKADEYTEAVKRLLYESPAGLIAAEDGYLLLARSEGTNTGLPEAFFSFARADERKIERQLSVRFGDLVELLGYDLELLAPRNTPQPAAVIRTYWRKEEPGGAALRFVYRIYAPEGHLANAVHSSPTERWYPSTRWKSGEVVVVEQRGVQVIRGGQIGVVVEHGDPSASIIAKPQTDAQNTLESGTVLRLMHLRRP